MSDPIEREDVYKALTIAIDEHTDIFDAIKSIPSTDRPQGEWIETIYTAMCGTDEEHKAVYRNVPTVKCSNCGKASPYQRRWITCPYCDARMKGAEDE